MNIKGLLLDIDGVIIGSKIGYNSPHPSPAVINALKTVINNGLTVSLCTAKPYFAIEELIRLIGADNFHISDGGSVITNPIKAKLSKTYEIDSKFVSKAVKLLIQNDIYTEVYTADNYFVQKSQLQANTDIAKGHALVLQREVTVVESLETFVIDINVTKIMPIALDETDKGRVTKIYNDAGIPLTLSWGVHPVILPLQFGIITAPGVSKKSGAKDVIEANLQVPSDILAVGDSTSDWQFMELCGFVATLENGSDELKSLVKSRKTLGNHGKSVDEDGLLDILKYYQLIE